MGFFKEFETFALRGNVLDLAVGLILGAEFSKIVNSLVNDVMMPPIGMLVGHVDFRNIFILLREGDKVGKPYQTLADAQAAGAVTINIGNFVTTSISFTIIAFAVFLIIRMLNRIKI